MRTLAVFAAVALAAGQSGAESVEPCVTPFAPPPQQPVVGTNPNVNAAIFSCQADRFRITEVSVDGATPVAVGPVHGNDAAAIDAALAEGAGALGVAPSALGFTGFTLVGEEDVVINEVRSAGVGVPAQLGVDYLGNPDDYTTWIAIGSTDVQVNVFLSELAVDSLRIEATLLEAPSDVPLPAGLALMLTGLGALGLAARRRS